ncbi:MAG TPA: hypothetical protein VN418_02200, partial [Gammaproteobacteria bacterium]|nr:hypothetical protein [Gammaproteobacteria bacterium]
MSHSTVLVVEDDLSLREALCDTLQLAGYPVLAAENGREALEFLDEGGRGRFQRRAPGNPPAARYRT